MARPPLPLGSWGKINRTQIEDGRWRARARYRDYDGMTRVVERYATSGAKAERALVEALTTRARVHGAGSDITGDTTLADVAAAWLKVKDRERLADGSLKVYEQTIRTHITPGLGQVRVREATVGVCERFIESKGSGSVAKRCRVVLSGMLALAAQHDAIDRNPVRETTAVTVQRKKPRALTVEELGQLRARVADWAGGNKMGKPRAEDLPELFDLMLGTGGRINETLPARWADVDLSAVPPTITLRRTKGGQDALTLVLPGFAVAALRRQRARGLPGDLIFPSRALTVRQRSNVGRQLRAAREHVIVDGLGRPDGPKDLFDWVTPHTFRRTVATIVDAEYWADAAAEQLGHSSKAVTEAHYIERRRAAADVTDALDTLAPVRSVSGGFSVGGSA